MIEKSRLRWFGHVERKDDDNIINYYYYLFIIIYCRLFDIFLTPECIQGGSNVIV